MGLLLLLFTLLLRRIIREEDTPHPLLMVTRAISLRVSLLLHLHLNRMSTTTATATTTAMAVTPASHSYEDVQLLFAAVAYWRNAASKKSYYICSQSSTGLGEYFDGSNSCYLCIPC
ncbi:uncharacterized protein [Typha latifolia]|uniref:uncharacterized protein n=1 Tax=Typha latifolia TaxID=4733 RepID=UPI003C2E729B